MKLTTFCPYPFPFIYLFNSILPDTFSWNISFYFTVTTATTAWQLDSVISINFNHNRGSIPWMVWKLSWYFAQNKKYFRRFTLTMFVMSCVPGSCCMVSWCKCEPCVILTNVDYLRNVQGKYVTTFFTHQNPLKPFTFHVKHVGTHVKGK